MKKILLALLVLFLAFSFTACDGEEPYEPPVETPPVEAPPVETPPVETPPESEGGTLEIWSFTDEVPSMVTRFFELNPDLAALYNYNVTIIPTTDGLYQPALDAALVAGGDSAPDLFTAESAFVLKYTQGEMSHFAAPYYQLGIDTTNAIAAAQIAPYTVEIGTRPSDGQVVALGYQATGGAFIYRRSIAEEVFGSDDPATVEEAIGAGSGNWDTFWEAAAQLEAAGYSIVSGDGDVWHAVNNSSRTPWIVNDQLVIDPNREAFLDISYNLMANNWHNNTEDWTDPWFADMRGEGATPAFGFFGPAWLINYVMADNTDETNTYGDWALARPPVGFFWGGTWVMANTNSEHLSVLGRILEWITLDTTTDGLLYMWANGTFNPDNPTKDVVSSGVVMDMSDGTVAFLGGQDMFDIFIPAGTYARTDAMTPYDEDINSIWRDAVRAYAAGTMTRDEAIEFFRGEVYDTLGFAS